MPRPIRGAPYVCVCYIKIRNYKILHDTDTSAQINTRNFFLFSPAEVSKPVKRNKRRKTKRGKKKKERSKVSTPRRDFKGKLTLNLKAYNRTVQ